MAPYYYCWKKCASEAIYVLAKNWISKDNLWTLFSVKKTETFPALCEHTICHWVFLSRNKKSPERCFHFWIGVGTDEKIKGIKTCANYQTFSNVNSNSNQKLKCYCVCESQYLNKFYLFNISLYSTFLNQVSETPCSPGGRL